MKNCILFIGLLLLVFGSQARETLGQARTLEFQPSDFRFLLLPQDATPPVGFERRDFDDRNFSPGTPAFGSGGSCPLQNQVRTTWPINSQLLVRHTVSVTEGATNVRVLISVDDDIIGVFFDDTPLVEHTIEKYPDNSGNRKVIREECPIQDEFRFDVPQELAGPGEHLVVAHVRDRGDQSFFNIRTLGETTSDDLARSLHPLADSVDRHLPRVPISEVTTTCPVPRPDAPQRLMTSTFRVDETGEQGQINIISSTSTSHITADFFLDGKQIASSSVSDTRAVVRTDPSVSQSEDMSQRVEAFDSVLRSPEFRDRIMACVAPPFVEASALECQSMCKSTGRRVRFTIWTGAQLSIFGGLIGAVIDEGVAWITTESVSRKECSCSNCCAAGVAFSICVDDATRPKRFDLGC